MDGLGFLFYAPNPSLASPNREKESPEIIGGNDKKYRRTKITKRNDKNKFVKTSGN